VLLSPLASFLRPKKGMSQDEFERLIGYLTAVPLFRKQLPKAELPRIAKGFKETVWQPDQVIIRRGDDGKAFYIIKSGRAVVLMPDAAGDETEKATLYAMDYFGGHTLTERHPNVATIVAKGPDPVVTYSMDKADFEELGLNKMLTFPRRPAIYEGTRTDKMGKKIAHASADKESHPLTPINEKELDFICKAVLANPNMRKTFGNEVCDTKVRAFAQGATRRRLEPGTELATSGELLQEFYIVASGSFSIFMGGTLDEHKSVEQNITDFTKAQKRLMLKEKFVRDLEVKGVRPKKCRVASSMKVDRETVEAVAAGKISRGRAKGKRATSLTARLLPEAVLKASPFQPGDQVAKVIVGKSLVKEVGTVVEITKHGRDGEVLVDFVQPPRQEKTPVRELRPADFGAPFATLIRGMCYGELSLLYNTRLVTTVRALEASEVYVMSRRGFKEAFTRESAYFEEHVKLLDDVNLLSPLVRSERWTIVRSASALLQFEAGEVVIREGAPQKEHNYLYVVKSGSAIVKQEFTDADGQKGLREVSRLRRAGCFGERGLFLRLPTAEATVEAGSDGLAVLMIHADVLRQFMAGSDSCVDGKDLQEYMKHNQPHGHTTHIPFSDLEMVRLLGEGGFGSVFLARTPRGEEFALKRLSKGYVVKAQAEKQVALERDILTMVDSNFIIKLYQTYKDREYVYMLLELCSGGHLFQLLNAAKVAGPAMLPSSVMFYIGSITFALEHLHERKIAFRDLKAENVLLGKGGYIKLCDMGFAKFVVEKTHTLLGTPEYMAPEMIDPPHGHDHMVDWWALGVLTFELFTGQGPWYNLGIDSDDPVPKMLAIRDSHDDGWPERLIAPHHKLAKDFIGKLLVISPKRRLGSAGAASVRSHQWFVQKSFDFDALYRQTLPAPELPVARSSNVPERLDHTCLDTDSTLFSPNVENGSDWDADF